MNSSNNRDPTAQHSHSSSETDTSNEETINMIKIIDKNFSLRTLLLDTLESKREESKIDIVSREFFDTLLRMHFYIIINDSRPEEICFFNCSLEDHQESHKMIVKFFKSDVIKASYPTVTILTGIGHKIENRDRFYNDIRLLQILTKGKGMIEFLHEK